MKEIWSDMDRRRREAVSVSEERIRQMAQRRSRSGLDRIILMERLGTVFSMGLVITLLAYFHRLEHGLEIVGGIGTLAILLAGVVLSLNIIRKAGRIDLAGLSYQQNLIHFAALKRSLRLYKKLSIAFNILLPFLMLPVVFRIFLGRDLVNDLPTFGKTLLLSAALAVPVLWLVIRYYRKTISQVRHSLTDTENITNKKDKQ